MWLPLELVCDSHFNSMFTEQRLLTTLSRSENVIVHVISGYHVSEQKNKPRTFDSVYHTSEFEYTWRQVD